MVLIVKFSITSFPIQTEQSVNTNHGSGSLVRNNCICSANLSSRCFQGLIYTILSTLNFQSSTSKDPLGTKLKLWNALRLRNPNKCQLMFSYLAATFLSEYAEGMLPYRCFTTGEKRPLNMTAPSGKFPEMTFKLPFNHSQEELFSKVRLKSTHFLFTYVFLLTTYILI